MTNGARRCQKEETGGVLPDGKLRHNLGSFMEKRQAEVKRTIEERSPTVGISKGASKTAQEGRN